MDNTYTKEAEIVFNPNWVIPKSQIFVGEPLNQPDAILVDSKGTPIDKNKLTNA